MSRAAITVWSVSGAVVVVAAVVFGIVVATSGSGSEAAGPTSSSASSPSTTGAGASATPSRTASTPPATVAPPGQQTTATPPAPSQGTTRASVSPFVTFDQWTAATSTLTIGATVPGIVESTGVCTLTATSGSDTVSQAFTASPSASSTDCGSMSVSGQGLRSGSWSISVTYTSPTAEGAVSDYEVTIP